MNASALKQGPLALLGLIVCACLAWAAASAGNAGASPVATAAGKGTCTKAKAKAKARRHVAKKSRIRCPGGGGTGSGSGGGATGGDTSGGGTTGGGTTTPPPDPAPNPDCPLAQAGSTIGMSVPSSCTVVASDTASNPDPVPFWGKIDCQDSSRHQVQSAGGDTHPAADGTSQANSAYRRMTVIDGDYVWGERCELGNNWSQPTGATPAGPGPTMFYREGERRATYASLRLPNTTAMGDQWRTVLQMKQIQPYNNPTPAPIIELQLRGNQWMLVNSWNGVWTAPAQPGAWTRFAFDVTYSANPAIGSIKVYADLNGDGDFADANEQSSTIHTATLEAETVAGGSSPYGVGQSIPDHLRAGIYQDPTYSCPTGCSMDLDNVQVVRP
jgi:hypothetical protein